VEPDPREAWRSSSDLVRIRSICGRSAALWATAGLVVEESRWIALSGLAGAEYNEALCHGPGGGAELNPTVDEILATGLPAVVSVAGEALREVQQLAARGWTCVGAQPLMARRIDDMVKDPAVRRLTKRHGSVARQLIEETFHVPAELARSGMPGRAAAVPGHVAWGMFEEDVMVSCMSTVVVEDAVVVWSMATPERYRRRGYARRLLTGAVARAKDRGANFVLLRSTDAGFPLYEALGFELLEWWQSWSRPRWVLTRD
jgi:GNAT superfamily N-acetyltransferase